MYPKLPILIAFNNCSARPTLPVQSDRGHSKPSDLPRHSRRKSKPPTADFLIFSVRILSNHANSVVDNKGRQRRVLGPVEKCSIQVKRRNTETHWPRCFVWGIDVKDQRNLALGILQPMKVNMEIHLPVCHLHPLTGCDACAPRGDIIPETLGTVVKRLRSVNYQWCQSSCVALTFNMQHCTRCEVANGNSKKKNCFD